MFQFSKLLLDFIIYIYIIQNNCYLVLNFVIEFFCLIIWICEFIFQFWKIIVQFFKELVAFEIWYFDSEICYFNSLKQYLIFEKKIEIQKDHLI